MSRASAEDLLFADQGSQERIPPVFLTACSGMKRSKFCLKKLGVWIAMSYGPISSLACIPPSMM